MTSRFFNSLMEMSDFSPRFAGDPSLRDAMMTIIEIREQTENAIREELANNRNAIAESIIKKKISEYMNIKKGGDLSNALSKILKQVRSDPVYEITQVELERQWDQFVRKFTEKEIYLLSNGSKSGLPLFEWAKNISKRIEFGFEKVLKFISIDILAASDVDRSRFRAAVAHYYCFSVGISFSLVALWVFGSKNKVLVFGNSWLIFGLSIVVIGILAFFALLIEILRYHKIKHSWPWLENISWVNVRDMVVILGIVLLAVIPIFSEKNHITYISFVFSILMAFSSVIIFMHPTKYFIDKSGFKLFVITGSLFVFWNNSLLTVDQIAQQNFLGVFTTSFYLTIPIILGLSSLVLTHLPLDNFYSSRVGHKVFTGWTIFSAFSWLMIANYLKEVMELPPPIILAIVFVVLFSVLAFLSFARLATVIFMRMFGVLYLPFWIILNVIELLSKELKLIPTVEILFLVPFTFSLLFGFLLFRQEFISSKTHLRAGYVIGRNLSNRRYDARKSKGYQGFHPVFGALFLRLGGAVGFGSTGIFSLHTILYASNGILANHGIAHDIAGFLQNNFGIPDGYMYSPVETPYRRKIGPGQFYSNPITGQLSGYLLWSKKLRDKPFDYEGGIGRLP